MKARLPLDMSGAVYYVFLSTKDRGDSIAHDAQALFDESNKGK